MKTKLVKIGLSICFMCLILPPILAQSEQIFPIDRFEQVLADEIKNSILSMMQAQSGFIWIGTTNGLYRFDGYDLKKYFYAPDDKSTISSNSINGLFESKDGKIWMSSWGGGMNLFDPKTETFKRFRHNPQNVNSIGSDLLRGVIEDLKGRVWIVYDSGLDMYDPAKKKFHHFKYHKSQDEKYTFSFTNNSVFADSKGRIWSMAENGLRLFNETTGNFRSYRKFGTELNKDISDIINGMREDGNGKLWAISSSNLYLFNPVSGVFTNYFSIKDNLIDNPGYNSSDNIRRFRIDAKNRIWIGTYKGKLYIINPDDKQFKVYEHNSSDPNTLGKDRIDALMLDKQDNVWVGNSSPAIYRLNTTPFPFSLYNIPKAKNLPSLDNNLNLILDIQTTNKNAIFINMLNSGFYSFDLKKGIFEPIGNRYNTIFTPIYAEKNSISSGWDELAYIKAFKQYQKKQIARGKQADKYRLSSFYSMHQLYLLETNKDTIQVLVHDPKDSTSLTEGMVFYIYTDKQGITWVCTSGGLNRFEYPQKRFRRYVSDEKNPSSISNINVSTIYQDRKKNYWVGTGHGLEHFDLKNEKFKLVYGKNGETGDVLGIAEDNHGYLWLYCATGIARFDPRTNEGRLYDEKEGLVGIKTITPGSFKQLSTGEIIAGGEKGYFVVFHPDSVRNNTYVPPVYVTNLSYYNGSEEIEVKGITEKKTLTLSYQNSPIIVKFAALNYLKPEKNQYAYKLEGIHKDWIPLGIRREITFTDLRSGNYTLHIKGSNNDGIWNEKGTTLQLIITPPWWQTTWFYGLLGLLLIGTGYAIYRYRIGQIEREAEYKQRLVEIETQALRAQMNPHFIFNAIHSIKRFLLSSDIDSAEAYMSKFARLMRLILDNSRTTLVSLQSEIELLENYIEIEQLRFGNKFAYRIEIDAALDADDILVPSLILQPFVENAIIHGLNYKRYEKGMLELNFCRQGEVLKIIIADNGVGRKKSKEIQEKRDNPIPRKSAGMDITTKRLQAFEQNTGVTTSIRILDLMDAEGQATGTRIEIEVEL